MNQFGSYFKARRLALGLSLRKFCMMHSIDPSNLSKLERGVLPPPQSGKLHEYARCLNLEEGSDQWYEFFDLAAAWNGRVPEDLREEAYARKLPVLFRTLRESARDGGSDSEELLAELKAKIKDA